MRGQGLGVAIRGWVNGWLDGVESLYSIWVDRGGRGEGRWVSGIVHV